MKSPRTPAEGIYRKVTVRIWGDEKFCRLTPLASSGQALWLYLLTGQHTGPIPGVFIAGKAALAETLNWEFEDFLKAFREVIGEGLAEYDEKTRMWFIPNAIRHNTPGNPNVVKSWRSAWMQLPECDLRARIFEHLLSELTEVSDAYAKAFQETCGKPFETASPKSSGNDSRNREQETGNRKQENERHSVSSPKSTAACPYDQIVGLYREKLPGLPGVRVMDDGRKRAMKARWDWVLDSKTAEGQRLAQTADEALAWFGEFFDRAGTNDWLMGRTGRDAKHANWRADLDYLMTDRGLKQVVEKTGPASAPVRASQAAAFSDQTYETEEH